MPSVRKTFRNACPGHAYRLEARTWEGNRWSRPIPRMKAESDGDTDDLIGLAIRDRLGEL